MVTEPTADRLLVATTNPGKSREIAELLGSLPIELVGFNKLAPAPPVTMRPYRTRTDSRLNHPGRSFDEGAHVRS